MKLYVSHGDKGGVGKSLLSSLVADHLLSTHGAVTIVEGDGTISDVARRYQGVPGVSGMSVDLARPDAALDAIMALFEAIEAAGCPENIVLNLPASASTTMDPAGDVIGETAEGLGYQLHVGWLMAGDEDSARLCVKSELCRRADRRVAIVNERTPSAWQAWESRRERKEWLRTGGQESRLPALVERAAVVLREKPGRLVDLTEPGSGLPLVTRQVLKAWLRACNAGPVAALIGDHGGDDGTE